MRWIQADRNQQWPNFAQKICFDPTLLSCISLTVREQMNALPGELRQQHVVVQTVLFLNNGMSRFRQCSVGGLRF